MTAIDEGYSCDAKDAMRQEALVRRSAQNPQQAGFDMAAYVLNDSLLPPSGAEVSGFWPIGDEIDVRPLMLALSERGHGLCLPVTPRRGSPLVFRRWRPDDALVPGRFGTLHPVGEVVVPDYVLVPLLAFDRAGNRLGYGGGYYDRTLAAMPGAFRLGCAFACQEVPAVPVGPADARLNAVATELGVIRVNQ